MDNNTGNSIFPLPIGTAVSDDAKYSGIRFGMIWNRFFKAMSDMLLKSRIAYNAQDSQNTKGFKYVINGALVTCVWVRPANQVTEVVVDLPYPSLFEFDVGTTHYDANTKQVTIASNTTYTSFWYLANLEAKGA